MYVCTYAANRSKRECFVSLHRETVMLQKGFDELLDDILCLQPQVFSHVESTTCIEVRKP